MAGILTIAKYKQLVPGTTLTDAQIETYLAAAQAIAEQISGLIFGAEVTAVAYSGGTYTLSISTPVGQVGDKIRLIGNGVTTDLQTITAISDTSVSFAGTSGWNPTKVLPVLEWAGRPSSGYLRVPQRPIFSVVSVQTRTDRELMWSSTDITTLTSAQYEVYQNNNGLKVGLRLAPSAIPRVAEGGQYLVKRMAMIPDDCVRIVYTAGFYAMVPADIQTAVAGLAGAIAKSVKDGGVFASESMDYYSYQTLSIDQMAALPQAAIATFKRYAN